jgi:hypothetical protein
VGGGGEEGARGVWESGVGWGEGRGVAPQEKEKVWREAKGQGKGYL